MFKEEFPKTEILLQNQKLLVDLWYQWIVTDYGAKTKEIIIPEKKPRKSKSNPEPKLTEEQKKTNRNKSKLRVRVENAIAWCKRFWIVSTIFRNKFEKFNDVIMEVACSLRNFHLVF